MIIPIKQIILEEGIIDNLKTGPGLALTTGAGIMGGIAAHKDYLKNHNGATVGQYLGKKVEGVTDTIGDGINKVKDHIGLGNSPVPHAAHSAGQNILNHINTASDM